MVLLDPWYWMQMVRSLVSRREMQFGWIRVRVPHIWYISIL